MKKIITEDTIKAIMDEIYKANPSLHSYVAIQKAFADLPAFEEPKASDEAEQEVITDLK